MTLDELRSYDGLGFLKAMIDGRIVQPPITAPLASTTCIIFPASE